MMSFHNLENILENYFLAVCGEREEQFMSGLRIYVMVGQTSCDLPSKLSVFKFKIIRQQGAHSVVSYPGPDQAAADTLSTPRHSQQQQLLTTKIFQLVVHAEKHRKKFLSDHCFQIKFQFGF